MSRKLGKYNMCKGIINATNGGIISDTDNNSKYSIIFTVIAIMLSVAAVIKILKEF